MEENLVYVNKVRPFFFSNEKMMCLWCRFGINVRCDSREKRGVFRSLFPPEFYFFIYLSCICTVPSLILLAFDNLLFQRLSIASMVKNTASSDFAVVLR